MNSPIDDLQQVLSPPLVGGDKGEGEITMLKKMIPFFSPPPLPSPIEGEG